MTVDQSQTPYADAILAYAEATVHADGRLHLPGHGGGTAGVTALDGFFGSRVAGLDLMPMLEPVDLGPAPTPLGQALRLAAQAWGARRTWFLTNGASQGNQMAVLALRAFGATLLVQRSVHSSVIDGLVMSGAKAEYIRPVVDDSLGAAQAVTSEAVAESIATSASAGLAAVLVVSPSYFGFVSDIAAIATVTHAAGLPLVVDEAWGAHLGFHPHLPGGALSQGADLVISSTHKLGGSLTQSAMLHLAEGPWAEALEEQLERVHPVLQSTSESALLLASLDLARHRLVNQPERIGLSVAIADEFRQEIRSRGRFRVASDDYPALPGWSATDPLRIAIDTGHGGITGHGARTILHREHGLLAELATETGLVGVIGAGAIPDLRRFTDELHRLPSIDGSPTAAGRLPDWGPTRLSVREAFLAPSEVVEWNRAAGRTSAASLAAYPPGIANILPGEEILPETIDYLRAVAASPAGQVRGALDRDIGGFRVVRDHQPA